MCFSIHWEWSFLCPLRTCIKELADRPMISANNWALKWLESYAWFAPRQWLFVWKSFQTVLSPVHLKFFSLSLSLWVLSFICFLMIGSACPPRHCRPGSPWIPQNSLEKLNKTVLNQENMLYLSKLRRSIVQLLDESLCIHSPFNTAISDRMVK